MQIAFQQVSYDYGQGTPFQTPALRDINFSIPSGTFQALAGHTGSGKSTLLQHLNGLLTPTKGLVTVGDLEVRPGKNHRLAELRKRVGIVFQFPEYQLFEETVRKDIAFGPVNFGASSEEAARRAAYWAARLGLSDAVLDRSPFELSGGQMRRVAIAGVLASEPGVLVLDEPTAGLDPQGQRHIMDLLASLHAERALTTVLVTHDMNLAARYATRVAILDGGRCIANGPAADVLADRELLAACHLEMPAALRMQRAFEERIGRRLPAACLTPEALAEAIVGAAREEAR